MTSSNAALTIPVFDPLGAVRALIYGWVLPAFGKGLGFVAFPFVRPFIREIDALLRARSDDEIERLIRRMERRNRRRAFPFLAATVTLGAVGGRDRAEAILTETRVTLPKFWAWWESERENSAAAPEVLSQMDAALYSACRSMGALARVILAGTTLPPLRLANFARAATASQVFVAALVACLHVDRDGPKRPTREATEALVRRTVADVADLSRFVARWTP